MRRLFLFGVVALLLLALVPTVFGQPPDKQHFVLWHHESQGIGDPSWTKCMPDDAIHGHDDHVGDYLVSDTDCDEPPPPPPPTDVCPNLDGIQTTVPNGYQLVNGQCVPIPPPPPPGTDLCSNLPGIQATLPPGYQLINGLCVPIPTPVPPPPPPDTGCGQYWILNQSKTLVETHPGQNVIYRKDNHALYGLDVRPGDPLTQGAVTGTGRDGNMTGNWLTLYSWSGTSGWTPLLQFRSPKCQPQNDLRIFVRDGAVDYWQFSGWEVVKAPAAYEVVDR